MIDGLKGKIIFPVKDLMAVSRIFEESEVFKERYAQFWSNPSGVLGWEICSIGKSYWSDKNLIESFYNCF